MSTTTEHDARSRPLLALAAAGGVAALMAIGFAHLPREHLGLSDIAKYALAVAIPKWQTTEPVNEIVYGTRGFDTFGETFILLAAVVSVTVLSRGREPRTEYVGEAEAGAREQRREPEQDGGSDRGEREAAQAEDAEAEGRGYRPGEMDRPDDEPLGKPGPEHAEQMTVVVRGAARVAAIPLAVASVYLAAWGFSPGGGFPAGAALVGVAVLMYAAFGYRAVRRVVRPAVMEPIEMIGAAAIIGIEVLGLVRKGSFSANWLPLTSLETIRSGGVLQAFSVAELVEVGTGLTIAIFALLGMGRDWMEDEPDGGSDGGSGSGADRDERQEQHT